MKPAVRTILNIQQNFGASDEHMARMVDVPIDTYRQIVRCEVESQQIVDNIIHRLQSTDFAAKRTDPAHVQHVKESIIAEAELVESVMLSLIDDVDDESMPMWAKAREAIHSIIGKTLQL